MKKLIWILILILLVGYCSNSYLERRARDKAETAEAERAEQAIRLAVDQMISQTNAISDWEQVLSGGKRYRAERILTIELERLWLNKRPILFFGWIKDITTHSETQYVVSLRMSVFSTGFGTNLELSLLSNKDIIDPLLEENPVLLKNDWFGVGVAAVANISSIQVTHVPGEYGEEITKVGNGKLIDIVYTGRTF